MDPTEEQIKNMSPEEILELQKKNCIFCQIGAGSVSSKKIYEDEEIIAVLDINPANPGHILVIPKVHYQIMPQVPDELIGKIFVLAKSLSQATLRGLGADGNTIFVANGIAAGQKAPHFMIHVIPRIKDDFLELLISERTIKESELVKIQSALQSRLRQIIGAPAKVLAPKAVKKEDKKPEKVVEAKFKEIKKEKPKKQKKSKAEKLDLDKLTELLGSGGKNG